VSSASPPAAAPLALTDPPNPPEEPAGWPPPKPSPEPQARALQRKPRRLPAMWTHTTPQGSYKGPLEDGRALAPRPTASVGDDDEAPAVDHRQSPLYVLWVLTRTEFRARYRAQALGILWSLLNPLVMMAIISVIFTQVFRSAEKHFPIFLLIGLLVWQWFTASVTAATSVFVANADIIKRTIFARALLPVSSVLSFGINFCLESLVLLAFIPIFPGAFQLSYALLLVPVYLLLAMSLMAGIALATSVLNVIYRDVSYLVNTALLILYWLTPLVYPLDVIPEPYRMLLQANPIAGILTALRRAIMHGEPPTALGWVAMVLPTALAVFIGWRIFRHYEHMVLDYV
jgi:lipopolysaccharide transport system permease protein